MTARGVTRPRFRRKRVERERQHPPEFLHTSAPLLGLGVISVHYAFPDIGRRRGGCGCCCQRTGCFFVLPSEATEQGGTARDWNVFVSGDQALKS